MTEKELTLGQAIDQIIGALESLEQSARQTAINAACSHLELSSSDAATSHTVTATNVHEKQPQQVVQPPVSSAAPPTDIRSLKEQKNPSSASQMACVVAYYLQELAPENERKSTVTAEDLEKYFKQAKFKLPKTISQLLPDSKAAGYFDSAPGKGEYLLNAVGYNLVAHNLPKKTSK